MRHERPDGVEQGGEVEGLSENRPRLPPHPLRDLVVGADDDERCLVQASTSGVQVLLTSTLMASLGSDTTRTSNPSAKRLAAMIVRAAGASSTTKTRMR